MKQAIKILPIALLILYSSFACIAQTTKGSKGHATEIELPHLRLDRERSMTFRIHFSQDSPVPDALTLVFVADFAVNIQKPNLVRVTDLTSTLQSEQLKTNNGRIFMNASPNYISDGKQQITWYNAGPKYFLSKLDPGRGDLSTLTDTRGPHIFFPQILFTADALNRLKFKADGTQIIDGKTVAVFRRLPHDEPETVLYVDMKTHLPVRASMFKMRGDWIEIFRSDFSDWKFDVKFPAETFDTKSMMRKIDAEQKKRKQNEAKGN